MSKFVLLHASLRIITPDGVKKVLTIGDVVDLPPQFVADVDPNGISFVTEAQYAALVDQVNANKKAQASLDAKAAELQTEQKKLELARVNSKHLAAVELIETSKKTSKPAAHPKDEGKKEGTK